MHTAGVGDGRRSALCIKKKHHPPHPNVLSNTTRWHHLVKIKNFSGITKQRNFISAELKKSYIHLHCSKNNYVFPSYIHQHVATKPGHGHKEMAGGAGTAGRGMPAGSPSPALPWLGEDPHHRALHASGEMPLNTSFLLLPVSTAAVICACVLQPATAGNLFPKCGCRTWKITILGHLLQECLFILKQKPTHKCFLYMCVPGKDSMEQLKKKKGRENDPHWSLR